MSWVSWSHGGVGPLAPFAEGYGLRLAHSGFTANSVVTHLSVMGQLSRWMSGNGLELEDLCFVRVEEFFESRRAGGQQRVPKARMFTVLLDYLTTEGVVLPVTPPVPATPLEALLVRYGRHLAEGRGLAPSTVSLRQRVAERFLSGRSVVGDETGVTGLCGGDVTAFLLRECSVLSVGAAKNRVTELRSLLRYLFGEGLVATDLAVSVPPAAGWRDTSLPATLAPTAVSALVSSCERSTPIGSRDFAILTLLARLGLRSCEVARLEVGDIDWRSGDLRVRGKGRGGEQHLPLPADVGEAIAGYLADGRPRAESRQVFLTTLAPLRGISPVTVNGVVRRACQRSGYAVVGPHRLRHALAAELLRRGATLPDISQVLRHRDLATTAVYAKVDLEALRAVAQPWPGGHR